ncbi:ABC transporter substrate-binding protein [Streptomyces sp. NPDC058254]|uniref:ABC transporter substrate-binding protein n=1 Tax=Streptomyces sp. NPDC058254 TaxID=3346406 RepID=UPI0036E70098
MSNLPGAFPSRRALLGATLAGGLALTGCSGSADLGSRPTGPPTGPRKRGGRFRFAPSDFGSAVTTDPQASGSSFSLAAAYTDTLVRRDHKWGTRPALAEEFAPDGKDLSTWTIRVRDGVTFHNGKPLTADDVIFTIRRNLDPKNPGFVSGLFHSIDPHQLTKLDKRTVRLKLKYPNSQLRDSFAEVPAGIVPVGFDPKKPIGTGPFKQQSFTPGQRWVGVRNEDYWMDGRPYLDSLELLGFSNADVARVNGLLSRQLDGIDRVPASQLAQLRQRKDLGVLVSPTGAFQFTSMRCDKGAQFEDNRVRQAFKLMIDRPQMVEIAFGGIGAVGNDVGSWAKFDPTYDSSLLQRTQDVDKARSLLKAAGMDGMSVSYRVGDVEPGAKTAASLMVQYAKAAGVKLELDVVSDLAQFYGSASYRTSQLKNDWNFTQSIYDNASYCWLPSGPFNNTGFDHPKANSLYRQALATTGSKSQELMHELSRVIWDEGPWLVWGRRDIADAYSQKFTGPVADASGLGFNGFHWEEISLA